MKIINFKFLKKKKPKAGTSWTAKNSDFAQQLIVDLGSVRNVTRMALQGRPHSTEYVTEYTISYGYNGLDFADLKERGGNVQVTTTTYYYYYYGSVRICDRLASNTFSSPH